MKRKGVLIACLLALLCGCGGSGRIAEIDREETYESGMAALAVVVGSMRELYDLAEAVAEVDVTDAECGELEDAYVYTLSTAQVTAAYKGELSAGDVITIFEGGGVMDGVEVYYGGVPTIRSGQHLLLFLVGSDRGNAAEYCVVGAYQGKFIRREGYYFQQATESVKLAVDEYAPQDEEGMRSLLASLAD